MTFCWGSHVQGFNLTPSALFSVSPRTPNPLTVPWSLDDNGLPVTHLCAAAPLPITVLCPSLSLVWPRMWPSASLLPSPTVTSFRVFGVRTAHHLPLSSAPERWPPEWVNVLYTVLQHQASSWQSTHPIFVVSHWLYTLDCLPRGQEQCHTRCWLPRTSLWV